MLALVLSLIAAASEPESAPVERIIPVAIFDEDDRKPISALRGKPVETLTREERLILAAASRTGSIMCMGAGSNGTLIRLADGRDAVLTTAHAFVDTKTGDKKCDLSRSQFAPNLSFNDQVRSLSAYSLSRVVKTDGGDPLNIENVEGKIGLAAADKDFLIFPLSENISDDVLPDGTVRGYMKLDHDKPWNADVWMIGRSNDFMDGYITSYQACRYMRGNSALDYALMHTCDGIATSSSSALISIADENVFLSGMHHASRASLPTKRTTPDNLQEMNFAVSIGSVISYLGATPEASPLTEAMEIEL